MTILVNFEIYVMTILVMFPLVCASLQSCCMYQLPFRVSCYDNLQKRLSKMVDLMQIMMYNMEFIVSQDGDCKELQEHINGNLEMLKGNASTRIKRLQSIMAVKSIDSFEHKLQEQEGFIDLESARRTPVSMESSIKDIDAFVQHSKEITDKIQGDEERKGKTILHLNSLGFCIGILMEETKNLENCIKEIIRWENPSRQTDFNQLCYKIDMANAP